MAAFALLGLPAVTHAKWRTVTVPEPSGETSDVALGFGGAALALAGTPTTVSAVFRGADGRFGRRERLARRAPPTAVMYAGRPLGALLSDGSAIAAWIDERTLQMPTDHGGQNGCCSHLQIAYRPRGSARFGAPQTYAAPDAVVNDISQIVTGPHGRYLILYRARYGSPALRFGAGGRLGPERAAPSGLTDVAFDGRGRAIATHGDSNALSTSIAGRSGRFGREKQGEVLPTGPDRPGMSYVAVATARDGRQVAVWKRRVGRRLHIEIARRSPRGAFGARRTLTRLGLPDSSDLRIAAAGPRALALVTASHRGRGSVRLFALSTRENWSLARRTLPGGFATPPDVRLAVAPSGRALLAVIKQRRRKSVLHVAHGTVRGSFGPLHTIARRSRDPIRIDDVRPDALTWSDNRLRLSVLSRPPKP